MDIQAIADRLEIQELLARYCHAIDGQDWISFRQLFTDDAQLDFTAFGGPATDIDGLIAFLQPLIASLASTHHMISTIVIDLDGDQARVRSAGHVPMTMTLPDVGEHTYFSGLWYDDLVIRTDTGWRFQSRKQERAWSFNLPTSMTAA